MDPQQWLEAATLAFNLIGMVVCLVGLTLAQKMQRRWPGYSLAVVGFIIATLPMLSQLAVMWQR
ncbi:hypothetical protein [Vreelandella sp.]|uniref:hypothetical protein n=1 Tax=Vreelandella sp. TaxID=3137778 RepID=UPI003BA8F45B